MQPNVSNKTIKSNLVRLDAMTGADIDYSDIPPLEDKFFEKSSVPFPPLKKQLATRLDDKESVVDCGKS